MGIKAVSLVRELRFESRTLDPVTLCRFPLPALCDIFSWLLSGKDQLNLKMHDDSVHRRGSYM